MMACTYRLSWRGARKRLSFGPASDTSDGRRDGLRSAVTRTSTRGSRSSHGKCARVMDTGSSPLAFLVICYPNGSPDRSRAEAADHRVEGARGGRKLRREDATRDSA